MSKSAQRWIYLGGAMLLVFFAANIALDASNVERLRVQSEWVVHTRAVRGALEAVISLVKDAETSQRGYLITGNDSYLGPYRGALDAIEPAFSTLSDLIADNPEQQATLAELRAHVKAKLDELEHTIALRRERGFDPAREVVMSDVGMVEMARIRAIVTKMRAREDTLLDERQAEASTAYIRAIASTILGGMLASILIVAYLLLLRRFLAARERATLEIAQQRELLQTTLASIGDAVITTDREGKVTFLNALAESLTGWKTADARGLDLTRVFHIVNEHTRETVENPAVRALREGLIVGLANHTILVARDGTERPIDDSAAPIRLGDDLFGCVLVFRDVTDRARMDAEMKAADRRKDEFLATLAHELRNPMAPISNALFVLGREDATAATGERALAMMQRQVKHMVRLIDDLLDVSRIRLGKIVLSRRPIALGGVIEQAVESVSSMIEASNHRLDVSLPAEPILVDADPIRLAQVFSNLLNNSAKFTPKGGVIRLTAETDGADAVVRVADNGEGIDPDHLDKVFELFAQEDFSLERSHGGLGIGLSLVRNLVEQHGGTVVARSEGRGRGSEFIVRLPLARGDVKPSTPTGAANYAAARRRKVLVVDDNKDGAESLRALVELMGHDARVAFDGRAALAIGAEWAPEVVLLDIGLPGVNGYEICREMRTTPWGRHALIVALTGWGQDQDRRRAQEAGFDRHVVKPIDEDELRGVLA
ncbi:MAG TPA: CHASE3 domain-containing protein [Usitatibacter sp.]|nr:CHASE3 domain-containing protein [Usitatibacter sp.]